MKLFFPRFQRLILPAIFLFGAAAFAQDFVATPPVTVAAGYGNYHPQAEVLGDGEIGVIWTNSSTDDLYFSKRTGGNTFGTPVQLNPAGLDVQDYNWSGADLSAWGNNVYVVFRSLGYETGHVYLVKSTDNGATFGDTVRIDSLDGYYTQYPDVAVYNDTVFVAHMRHGFTVMDPQYYVSRSADGGATFETEVDVTGWLGLEACDCCQPEIIVDDERVIVFYRQNDLDTRDIKAVVSHDRGATFTEYLNIDDHNWTIAACPSTGPDARFYSDSIALSAYRTTISGTAKIFLEAFNVETAASVSTTDIYMDGASNSGINYPQLAVSGSIVGLVWEGLGSSTDVFFNGSATGASGILPANAINVTNETGSQSKPDVVYLDGAFHVFYSELSGSEVRCRTVTAANGINAYPVLRLQVFPNPFTNEVSISGYEGEMLLTIYSADGTIVSRSSVVEQDKTDVSHLAPGVYFFSLMFEDHCEVHRVIKN
jgi:hypothetical protein